MKVRNLFQRDLEQTSRDGTVGMFMFVFLRTVRKKVKADVTFNEGMNSLVKHVNNKCPTIRLPLLDARAGLKAALGFAEPQSWKKRLPAARSLLDSCLAGEDLIDEVLGEQERWLPPVRSTSLPPDDTIRSEYDRIAASTKLTLPMLWAAPFCVLFHRKCLTPTMD